MLSCCWESYLSLYDKCSYIAAHLLHRVIFTSIYCFQALAFQWKLTADLTMKCVLIILITQYLCGGTIQSNVVQVVM